MHPFSVRDWLRTSCCRTARAVGFARRAAWRRGITYARWFVTAWLVYGGMLLLNAPAFVRCVVVAAHRADLPARASLNLLEVVMLAMAQSDRLRLLQRDQQLAEQRYRELLESYNDVLERMVG